MRDALDTAVAVLEAHAVAYTIHEHDPARTVADARQRLPFPLERFLKTVAFRLKAGGHVLAAVRGPDRIDYRKLAAAAGTKRSEIVQLAPGEVREVFAVEVGSVGPLLAADRARVLFDTRVPADDTVFCGIGRADRTLEIRLEDLLRLTRGERVPLARQPD